MYVYDRDGHYKGRAGKPVRDARTGKMQPMSSTPPKKAGGCFTKSAALVALAVTPLALLAAGLAHWI
jgi:hypothetical protein